MIRNLEPCVMLSTFITSYKLKQEKKEFKSLYSDLKAGNEISVAMLY